MNYLFKILFIFLSVLLFINNSNGQDFRETFNKIKASYGNKTLTLETLDSVILDCPNIEEFPDLLFYKGELYRDEDNYPLAIKTYLELQELDLNPWYKTYAIKGLGTLYCEKEQFDKGVKCFTELLEFATLHKDTLHINFAKENILHINIDLGNLDAFEDLESLFFTNRPKIPTCNSFREMAFLAYQYNSNEMFNECNLFLKKNREWTVVFLETPSDCLYSSSTGYYYVKAMLALHNNKYNEALKHLDSIHNEHLFPVMKQGVFSLYAEAYEKLGQYKLVSQYKDSALIFLGRNKSNSDITNSNFVSKNNLEKKESQKKVSALFKGIISFGFIIILLSIYFLYSRKNRKKLQSGLKYYKTKYNDLWNNYQLSHRKLKEVKTELNNKSTEINPNKLKVISSDITLHLTDTDEHKHFNLAQIEFLKNLETKAPYLNQTEKIICFYLNKKMAHKDIGILLNKSEKSIHSYKYRAIKKIKQNEAVDIDEFIKNL